MARSYGELSKMLAIAGSNGPARVANVYLENIVEIHESLARLPGLKLEMGLQDISKAADYLRFAAIAYDQTSAHLLGGVENTTLWLTQEGIQQHLGVDQLKISIHANQMDIFADPSRPQFYVGLAMRSDRSATDLLAQTAPLIESGRVLIRPQRIIIALSGQEGNKNQWKTLEVRSGSPFEFWEVVPGGSEHSSLQSAIGMLEANEFKLFEITIPFLAGISFKELVKVLEDESEHIAKCRLHLRELVSKATKENARDLTGFVNDILKSEVDALKRRLTAIARLHSLRVAGVALGSVTLSLVAASSGGWTQALATVAGAGGLVPLASELASYVQKRAEQADDPLYLLWRLRKLRR